MIRFIILLSSILIILGFWGCKQGFTCKDINERYFTIIENLNNRGDTLDFVKKLTTLIETKPFCAKAFQVRGYFRMLDGEFSPAKSDFLSSLCGRNSSIYSYYCLSGIYNIEEKNDSALFYVEKAIKGKLQGKYVLNSNNYFKQYFDIDYGTLTFQLGLIYYEMDKPNLAKRDFLKAIHHDYDKGEAYAYLAAVSLALKNVDSSCFYQNLAKQNSYDTEIDPAISNACNKKEF